MRAKWPIAASAGVGVVGGAVAAVVVGDHSAQTVFAALSFASTVALLIVTYQYVNLTRELAEATRRRGSVSLNQIALPGDFDLAMVVVRSVRGPVGVEDIAFEWADPWPVPSFGWTRMRPQDLGPVAQAVVDQLPKWMGANTPDIPHVVQDGGADVWAYRISADTHGHGYRAIRARVGLTDGTALVSDIALVRPLYTQRPPTP